MNKKILVYGYYNKSNLGDDLFADAFRKLFPDYQFTFTDNIKSKHLDVDAVFFGGGSFLAETLKCSDEVFEELKKRKLFYIGVGTETDLDPKHEQLMKLAQVVAVRTSQNLDKIQALNPNCMVIPDLVYSLEGKLSEEKLAKTILVIPNILVVPKWNEPHWKHVAWEYFKSEFIQAVDALIGDGYYFDFLPFCENSYLNDSYAAAELLARSSTMKPKKILKKPKDFQEAIEVMSQYRLVVTQRFHGKILSDIAGVPSLTVHHHDKLKGVNSDTLSYYGMTKSSLLSSIKNILTNSISVLPIDRDIFRELHRRVDNALYRSQE